MTEDLNRSSTELVVLRRQAHTTWTWFEATVGDVTTEQAKWVGPT